jgi:general secretion pathway protein C
MVVRRAIHRCIPILNLTLVALAAYFQAFGITRMIGAALAPGDEQPTVGSVAPSARASPLSGAAFGTPAVAQASDHATSARAILDRNPFDSVTPRPLDAATVGGRSPCVDISCSDRAPLCDGYKALVVLASPNPAWSMAAVRRNEDPSAKLVRIGDGIGPNVVQLVEWNRVVLSSGASPCQIVMFRARAPSDRSSDSGAVITKPAAASDVPADIKRKIRKLSPNEFDVDRQAVAEIIANHAELMRGERIVPEREKGEVAGIRLLGVRPESLLGALGLENGDRLDSINGIAMTSPENGLQALAQLRTADHLGVRVSRRGKEVTLDFNIR